MNVSQVALVTGVRPIAKRAGLRAVARALVVVGEALGAAADLDRAVGDVDQLQAVAGHAARGPPKLGGEHAAERHRLQHRLGVLELVADHELVQLAVATGASSARSRTAAMYSASASPRRNSRSPRTARGVSNAS